MILQIEDSNASCSAKDPSRGPRKTKKTAKGLEKSRPFVFLGPGSFIAIQPLMGVLTGNRGKPYGGIFLRLEGSQQCLKSSPTEGLVS